MNNPSDSKSNEFVYLFGRHTYAFIYAFNLIHLNIV